jgi:hypothetical protein
MSRGAWWRCGCLASMELFERHGLAQGERVWQGIRQALEDQLEAWCRGRPGTVTAQLPGDLFVLLLADARRPADDPGAAAPAVERGAGSWPAMGLSSLAADCALTARRSAKRARPWSSAEPAPANGFCDFSERACCACCKASSIAR